MNNAAQKVVSDALELPPMLRAFVAEKLIESLDVKEGSKLSARWRKEIRRRCAEIGRRAVVLRDADVVFDKAYSSLV